MSNNTPNYQEYTFSKLLEQYDKILVPMIQRDYAQGRTDKKATDVRNNLLNDIFSGKDVHFDLVFGSKEKRIIDGKEMNCFIPVDGQQRLTTLFLLHLYRQKAGKTNTEFDLSKFSYDTRRAASDFCKSITSEEWTVQKEKKVSDVIKDSSWFMNYWEKDPTVEGMLNMLDAIHEKCKEITDYPDLNKVTFFFFDLESNGLNENLYLKMNSRGKPLTAFENLKAKMEKILPENVEFEDKCFPNCDASPKDSFKAKWKYFMDRNWTEAFWDKAHPENYDESITKFIVRFLAGYWAAYGTDEEQMANDLKSLNSKDIYADFIPFEPVKKVLEKENAFSSLAYALTTVPKIDPYWTNDTIKVSDKSEYKFLAVIFTYVLFDGDKNAMRFAWNMAENYVTGYDTFVTYCKQVKKVRDKFNSDENIAFYKTLSENDFSNPSEQLTEEIAKAKQILDENENPRKYKGSCKKEDGSDYQTWEEIIIEAEKYAFFKGAIRFLYTTDGNGKTCWDDFDTKWEKAKTYFDKNGELPNSELLKSFICYFNKWEDFKQIYYDNKLPHWKSSLLNSKLQDPLHQFLMAQKPLDFSSFQSHISDDEVKNVQNQIVKTNLLEKIPMDDYYMEDGRILHRYYKNRDKDIYIWNPQKKELLSKNHIECEKRIANDCDFFYGKNINFKYKYNDMYYFFQWYGYPSETGLDVYLMEDDWKDYKKRTSPTNDKGTDEDKYYCFRVDKNQTEEGFIGKLNELINQVT